MNTFLALLTITIWYYFIIMLVINKESKDKIFNVSFMTLVFLLLIVVISFLELTIVNFILFLIYFILAHWFYTDFAIFIKINEFFIKRQDITQQSGESIQYALFNIIKEELKWINKELYSMIKLKNIWIDIILITYSFILYFIYILHLLWMIKF